MNINKKITVVSTIFIIFMVVVAVLNIRHTDTSIKLNDKIRLLPTNNYNLEIRPITKDDIIVKIKTTNEIGQSNNSICIKTQITDVYNGAISKGYVYIYDKNSYYKDPDKNEYISIYSSNILIPDKEYYVILENLTNKFFYMNNNSYKLKDDLSVFKDDSEYIISNENSNFTFGDLKNFQYIFTSQEQVKDYSQRKQILKKYVN